MSSNMQLGHRKALAKGDPQSEYSCDSNRGSCQKTPFSFSQFLASVDMRTLKHGLRVEVVLRGILFSSVAVRRTSPHCRLRVPLTISC